MITINKTSLPESITYKGKKYVNDIEFTRLCCENFLIRDARVELYSNIKNKNVIKVNVLSANLRGKKDLYGRYYQPTEWLFTCLKK